MKLVNSNSTMLSTVLFLVANSKSYTHLFNFLLKNTYFRLNKILEIYEKFKNIVTSPTL